MNQAEEWIVRNLNSRHKQTMVPTRVLNEELDLGLYWMVAR